MHDISATNCIGNIILFGLELQTGWFGVCQLSVDPRIWTLFYMGWKHSSYENPQLEFEMQMICAN